MVRDARRSRPWCGTHAGADRGAGRPQEPTVVRDARSSPTLPRVSSLHDPRHDRTFRTF